MYFFKIKLNRTSQISKAYKGVLNKLSSYLSHVRHAGSLLTTGAAQLPNTFLNNLLVII